MNSLKHKIKDSNYFMFWFWVEIVYFFPISIFINREKKSLKHKIKESSCFMFWFWVEIVYFFPISIFINPKKKKKEGLKLIWHPKALIVNTWNKTKNQTKHTKRFIWIFWKTTLKTQSLLPISSINNNSHNHNSNKKYIPT